MLLLKKTLLQRRIHSIFNRHSLSYEILNFHPNLINEKFNLVFTADEHLINYKKLKKIVEERLGVTH